MEAGRMPGAFAGLWARFRPSQPAPAPGELARAAAGAAIGLAITAAVSTRVAGASLAAPLLIAPLGASAVLLFAVPASPLAQPYAMLGGNLLAALIGITAAHLLTAPILAAPVAVALALAAMMLCRCVHPPSGAVALVAVLGGPHVVAQGYNFVAIPVMFNSILLVAAAIGWNNLVGRSYPHLAHPVATAIQPSPRLALRDFEAVIAQHGDTLTIDAADLRILHEALIRRVSTT